MFSANRREDFDKHWSNPKNGSDTIQFTSVQSTQKTHYNPTNSKFNDSDIYYL